MQFLNDKFFKIAVILFFFLMALPFMFSEPEPEKKDNTPALEFEEKNPVYKILNRIARFYGFKKGNDNTDFTLNEEQISQIRKQVAEKEEQQQSSQSIKDKIIEKTQQNSAASGPKQNTSTKETKPTNPTNNAAYKKTNTYAKLNNETYEVLEDKDNKKYLSKGKTLIPLDSLPKSSRNSLQMFTLPATEKETKNIKISDYTNTKTAIKTQNEVKENNKTYTSISSAPTSVNSSKTGSIGSIFKPTTKAGQDFLQNIDNNIKNISFVKQNNKTEQEQTKQTYTKSYKTQFFNPKTKKTEEAIVQQQIEPENIKTAEEIKRITAENISPQGYNKITSFAYNDNYNDSREIPFPKKDDIITLPEQAPPHILIPEIASKELDNSFEDTYRQAQQQLPTNPKDIPFLEFIYKNSHSKILREANDSFNVMTISRLLANKVYLQEQNDIDFLDTRSRIYVVPEEQLYREYVSMHIPVIYYPQLSPQNLGTAYETAKKAIETFLSNKDKKVKAEQSQNKSEIESLLKNQNNK